jgi:hypothetical protein
MGHKKTGTSMWGGIARVLGRVGFPDDRYRNQLQRAEAGLPYKTSGLSRKQLQILARTARK